MNVSVKDQEKLDSLYHQAYQSMKIANNMSEYRMSAEKDLDKYFVLVEKFVDKGVD